MSFAEGVEPMSSINPASAVTPLAEVVPLRGGQTQKDLYEVGEIPPLGHVPKKMYAWVIRQERHGEPETAMQDRKSTRLNSSHVAISYAVFCLKKKMCKSE